MGNFHLYVRFSDGEVWHGVYDSITDTCARFLAPTRDDVAGWAMEGDYREDGDLDGRGEPVDIATDYGDFHWAGTALRLDGPGQWCWLTGPVTCDDDTTIWGRPEWLDDYLRAEHERARADLCDSIESLAGALDETVLRHAADGSCCRKEADA